MAHMTYAQFQLWFVYSNFQWHLVVPASLVASPAAGAAATRRTKLYPQHQTGCAVAGHDFIGSASRPLRL